MKTKIFIFISVLLILSNVYGQQANTRTSEAPLLPPDMDSTENYSFEIIGNRGVAIITGYYGLNTSIWIPAQIRGMPVVTVREKVFYRKGLETVRISNNIILIEKQAFAGNEIVQIIIPANVTLFDDSFDLGFPAFYMANERRAGNYSYRNGRWEYGQTPDVTVAPKEIPAEEDKPSSMDFLQMEPYGRIGMGVGFWDYGYSIISPKMYLNLGLMVVDSKNFKLGFTAEGGCYLGTAFPDFEDAGISYGFYFGSFLELYFDIFGIAIGGGMNKVYFVTKHDLLPNEFLPFLEIDLMLGDEEETFGVYFRYYFNDINGFANKFAVGIKHSIDF